MSNSTTLRPVSGRRSVAAACFGNAVEWYDFAVYGFLAVYIGANFFPSDSRAVELLSAFVVFGLTFVARPLAGLIIGPIADRIGRRNVLVVVLVLMAAATTAIGLLPTHASVGVAAPVLLMILRILQGFSAGGEYSSVATFVVESAGRDRRGVATAWLMVACMIGFLAGALFANVLTLNLSAESMTAWGWRIPFLVAAPLGLIGLYIRLRLEETPEFAAVRERGEIAQAPLRQVFCHRRAVVAAVGISAFQAASFYFVMTFLPTFVRVTLDRGDDLAFLAALASGVAAAIVGGVGDRHGRRPVLVIALVGFLACIYPLFLVIERSNALAAFGAFVLLGCLLGVYISTAIVAVTEIFPTTVRASAGAIGYSLPAAIFGGSAPFVGVWLTEATGSVLAPALYIMAVAIIGLMALLLLPSPVADPDLGDTEPVNAEGVDNDVDA